MIDLNNRRFIVPENGSGLSSDETIFEYNQTDNIITGRYEGGSIKKGFIVGKQIGDNAISLLYQCITVTGELKAGESKGVISKNKDGRLLITFDWRWLDSEEWAKSEHVECV